MLMGEMGFVYLEYCLLGIFNLIYRLYFDLDVLNMFCIFTLGGVSFETIPVTSFPN